MPVDQPLSGKPTISSLTDDDRVPVIDAPGTTAATRLIVVTNMRAYMQNGVLLTSDRRTNGGTLAEIDPATGKLRTDQTPTPASGVTSFNGRTGAVTLTVADIRALMTDALGTLPLAEMVSTDGRTGTHIYVGVNDPTSVAGGSKTAVNGDVQISDA
jgi:hypothetical protein